MHVLDVPLLIASLLGIAYLCVANAVVRAFARRPLSVRHHNARHPQRSAPSTRFCSLRTGSGAQSKDRRNRTPSITVLKPISGTEPLLYENLASFCDQDYGDYEVFFCLHRADDSAAPIVNKVIADFPVCTARMLVGDDRRYRNPKIANLAKGAALARGDAIVISDSDVRVGRTYLQSVAASFEGERTGAISSLYRGIPGKSWISQLGAAYVEEQFAPSVLVAATIGRMRFCLGASMAVRRDALQAIGGIDALGPYLADDHKLGELVAARGYDVELSRYVVSTTIPETTLPDLWAHELRWARTNLMLAPLGYAFSFLMFGVPIALLYLLVSRNWIVALPVLAVAVVLRVALGVLARKAFDVPNPASSLWMIPLRDAFSVAVWTASFFGRAVRWRQSWVRISPDGQMQ